MENEGLTAVNASRKLPQHEAPEQDEHMASTIPAIDVHGHYGEYARDEPGGLRRSFMGAGAPIPAAQRARIDQADLSEREKQMILRDNARRVLGIE